MRTFLTTALAAVAVATLSAQNAAPDPAAVLSATRNALGGEKKLTAVKTFVATGRTQQVRGDNLVPIEFEIAVELPDRYVRKDEIPAQESGPTSTGFNGDTLIQLPAAIVPQGRPGGPPPPTPEQQDAARRARVAGVKQDFARLTLAMFAASFASYPLTFTYAGQGEAPQGKADVLDVKGAGDFTARLFIDQATHLPIMVSWQGASPRGGSRGENRIYFADYRDVDGMKWPFRLRRALGAETVEETTFDRFRVNPRIDPKKFQP
jgi:hypothetical protein